MRKIKFVASRFDACWSYKLSDGRLIEIMSLDGKFSINYNTPFNLETGEIAELPKDAPIMGRDLPDYAPEGFTTLNNLKAQGNGETVYCYDEHDVYVGCRPVMTATKVEKILKNFKKHGFNVTADALHHNYSAWRCDMKSGYRDEKNGYHLFTPCGCNPLSFRATTLNEHCTDWQETYKC